MRQHANRSMRRTKQNRVAGYICHVGKSRSGIFWAIIKDEHGIEHFSSWPQLPHVSSSSLGRSAGDVCAPATVSQFQVSTRDRSSDPTKAHLI